jgi:hypothetical protein
MKTKLLEIRDRATCIVVLCVDMNPDTDIQRSALRSLGYACDGEPNIMMTYAGGEKKATNDPYFWGDRTMTVAHNAIIDTWKTLKDGDVVDVEFILGETKTKKISERFN